MISKEICVNNQTGLESKAAAILIMKASTFKSSIWVERDERKANVKSLLGLLSLGIGSGSKIVVTADGEDEEKALEEITNLIKAGL